MKTCSKCGQSYPDSEPTCPNCDRTERMTSENRIQMNGNQRSSDAPLRSRRVKDLLLGAAAAAVVFLLAIAVIAILRSPQRALDKAAAEQYEAAMRCIDSGDYDQALDILGKIDEDWRGYRKVSDAKNTALKGQLKVKLASYEADGNYEAILQYLSEHTEDLDSDAELKRIYDDSVIQYKQAVLKKADEYANAEDYPAASSVLTTAIRMIGEDLELQEKLDRVQMQSVLAQVKKYQADGNYVAAISLVNDNLDKVKTDTDIMVALSSCEDAYRREITANAEAAFQSGGYESAVSVVGQGLKLLKNDDELNRLKAHYQGYQPVSLLGLEIYTSNLFEIYPPLRELKDSKGYLHNHCYQFYSYFPSNEDHYVRWDLDGKYTVLKGHIYTMDSGPYQIEIYDGETLLYTTDPFSDECVFEVDITNVKYLTLRAINHGYYRNGCLIAEEMNLFSY